MNNRNFFQKLQSNYQAYPQKYIRWKRPIRVRIPKAGSAFGRHALILLRRIFRCKNTRCFGYITSTRADNRSSTPGNQGFPTCAAARAGLLLGELALVNWSSCQLVVLQCRSFHKSRSNFSERAVVQIQNFRAYLRIRIREWNPRGAICNLKQPLRSAIGGVALATQSRGRQSCLLFTPALN